MTGSVVVDAGAPAGDQTVSITGSAFVNATVTIRPGAKVTWTNNDGIAHTVTSNS
jgi:plastocyanin